MASTKDNPFGKIKHKTRGQWHCYLVFEDPEFKKDVSEFEKWLIQNSEKIGVNTIPEEKIAERNKREEKILHQYLLSSDELLAYIYQVQNSDFIYYPFMSVIQDIDWDYEGYTIEVQFQADMRYEEYVNAWKDIQDFIAKHQVPRLKQRKRRRAPDDPHLIYAIFKAKQSGKTFKSIFDMYQDGNLPYYKDKVTNQFSSEDSLESYYQKYKPKPSFSTHD